MPTNAASCGSCSAFAPFGMSPPVPPRIDPAAPGTYFFATKGHDPAPDEATVPDEVSNNAVDRPVTDGLPSASRPGADAKPSARSRSAATNRPASRWNSNSAGGRRCRDLFRGYMRALGSPADEPTVALAIAAAEAVALAETARQDCLSGMTAINVELMIRLDEHGGSLVAAPRSKQGGAETQGQVISRKTRGCRASRAGPRRARCIRWRA